MIQILKYHHLKKFSVYCDDFNTPDFNVKRKKSNDFDKASKAGAVGPVVRPKNLNHPVPESRVEPLESPSVDKAVDVREGAKVQFDTSVDACERERRSSTGELEKESDVSGLSSGSEEKVVNFYESLEDDMFFEDTAKRPTVEAIPLPPLTLPPLPPLPPTLPPPPPPSPLPPLSAALPLQPPTTTSGSPLANLLSSSETGSLPPPPQAPLPPSAPSLSADSTPDVVACTTAAGLPPLLSAESCAEQPAVASVVHPPPPPIPHLSFPPPPLSVPPPLPQTVSLAPVQTSLLTPGHSLSPPTTAVGPNPHLLHSTPVHTRPLPATRCVEPSKNNPDISKPPRYSAIMNQPLRYSGLFEGGENHKVRGNEELKGAHFISPSEICNIKHTNAIYEMKDLQRSSIPQKPNEPGGARSKTVQGGF